MSKKCIKRNSTRPLRLKGNTFDDGGGLNGISNAGAAASQVGAITGGISSIINSAKSNAEVDSLDIPEYLANLKHNQIYDGGYDSLLAQRKYYDNARTNYNTSDFYHKSATEQVGNVAGATLSGVTAGLSVGGPVGAVIGGVIGAGASIGGIISGKAEAKSNAWVANELGKEANVRNDISYMKAVRRADKNNYLNMYKNISAYGGNLSSIHGGDFYPGDLTFINAGGTHESNPYGGVPSGVDENGVPNLVEEGEVIFNNYVYSNRIAPTEEDLARSGIPNKYAGKTFAYIAEKLSKEAQERPNDVIAKKGLQDSLGKLAMVQEAHKAKEQAARAEESNKFYDGGDTESEFVEDIEPAVIVADREAPIEPEKSVFVQGANGEMYGLPDIDYRLDYLEDIADEDKQPVNDYYYPQNTLKQYAFSSDDSNMQDYAIWDEINRLNSDVYANGGFMEDVREKLSDVWDDVKDKAGDVWDDTKEKVKTYSEKLADRIAELKEKARENWKKRREQRDALTKKLNTPVLDPQEVRDKYTGYKGYFPYRYPTADESTLNKALMISLFDPEDHPESFDQEWENKRIAAQTDYEAWNPGFIDEPDVEEEIPQYDPSMPEELNPAVVQDKYPINDVVFPKEDNLPPVEEPELIDTPIEVPFDDGDIYIPPMDDEIIPAVTIADRPKRELKPVVFPEDNLPPIEEPVIEEPVETYLQDDTPVPLPAVTVEDDGNKYIKQPPQWRPPQEELKPTKPYIPISQVVINDEDDELPPIEEPELPDTSVDYSNEEIEVPELPKVKQRNGFDGEWFRYAPIIGSGIAALQSALQDPDYRHTNMMMDAMKRSRVPMVAPRSVGRYATYNPTDQNYLLNRIAASSAATNRSLESTNAASRQAALLANNFNTTQSYGDALASVRNQNNNLRNSIYQYNTGIDQANAQLAASADSQNARSVQMKQAQDANIIQSVARMRQSIDDQLDAQRSANLTTLFNNLGQYGNEVGRIKMANRQGYQYDPATNNYYKVTAKGGKIKRGCK